MQKFSLFPCELLELKYEDFENCNDLIKYIQHHVEKYKYAYQQNVGEENVGKIYYTNFFTEVTDERIESCLNKFKQFICDSFKEFEIQCNISNCWFAVYDKNAVHLPHIHSTDIGPKLGLHSPGQYSGILYLTSIGDTIFYSPNALSRDMTFNSQSTFGKVIIFPSQLIHSVGPHNQDVLRYVISFNMSLN